MDRSLSRRGFARLLGAGVALAAAPAPRAAVALAGSTPASPPAPGAATAPHAGTILLNANENPYGPSPAAIAAVREALPLACRYPDEAASRLAGELARHHSLDERHLLLGSGSAELLRLAVAAAARPERGVVVGRPSYEAVSEHARDVGAPVVEVPLTADYRHDLRRMFDAAATAGLVYVCNPNNPTASVTPAAELRSFLAAVPKETLVLVDEAYHHFAAGGGYETVVPLVGELPNLLVTRTFSKIYGMAGLRCGYGIAQPSLLARLRAHKAWDSPNVMGLVAASAALADQGWVETSRRRNAEVRDACCRALAARGWRVVPTQANFFMVDLGTEVRPVIAAMRDRGVAVGRPFPALPTHLRVTVGTEEEMRVFLAPLMAVLPAAA